MNHIFQRFAGVAVVLMLCLMSSVGWVKAQNAQMDPESASDSATPSELTEDPVVVIKRALKRRLKPRFDQPGTDEATLSPEIEIEGKGNNIYFVSITSEGKTPEGYGLFDVHWDLRQVANLIVFVDRHDSSVHYRVVSVDRSSELKAPLGKWRPGKWRSRDFALSIPSVGETISKYAYSEAGYSR